MTKRKIKSGSIIQLKLNHDLGYIFAKVVNMQDFSELDLSKSFHYIIYPYDYIENKSNSFSISKFLTSKPLTSGLLVINLEKLIKTNIWNIVADTDLLDYEKQIPDFRGFGPIFTKYEIDAKSWLYIENGLALKWILTDYEKVKHLENNTVLSYDLIEKRLSMEILRKQNKNIKDYYELEEWKDLCVYYNMIYTTPFIKVPDKHKGRAIK